MKNIDFKSLIESAERAKLEKSVIALNFGDVLDLIIVELKKCEQDHAHVFSERVGYTIMDSMPWNIPFFRELMAFLDEHDKYHKAMSKLKKNEENK